MFSGRISEAVARQIEKKIAENNNLNSLSNSELADLAVEFVGDAPPSHVPRETVIEILSQQPQISEWRTSIKQKAIAAAKGGIEAMVRSAAATYARRGLRINAVAPGLTDTKMASKILASDAMREAASQKIPTQRINQKQEAASAMFWLLTDAPDNLTGQVLHLDGGMANVLV